MCELVSIYLLISIVNSVHDCVFVHCCCRCTIFSILLTVALQYITIWLRRLFVYGQVNSLCDEMWHINIYKFGTLHYYYFVFFFLSIAKRKCTVHRNMHRTYQAHTHRQRYISRRRRQKHNCFRPFHMNRYVVCPYVSFFFRRDYIFYVAKSLNGNTEELFIPIFLFTNVSNNKCHTI